jgi:hypothetical protein
VAGPPQAALYSAHGRQADHPGLLAHAAITTLTWRDLRRRPAEQVRGGKRLWRVASAVNTVGSMAYLAVGRKRSHAD